MAPAIRSRGQPPNSALSPHRSADPTAHVLRLRPRTSSRDRRSAASADCPCCPVTGRKGVGRRRGERRVSTAPAQALPSLLPVPQPRPVSGVSRPCLVLSVSPLCRVMIAPALTLQHAYSKVQRGGGRPSHSTRLCTLLSPPPFWNFPWDSAVLGGRLGKLSPALEGGWLGKR